MKIEYSVRKVKNISHILREKNLCSIELCAPYAIFVWKCTSKVQ